SDLGLGLALAVGLTFLVIVPLFRSWLQPLIILICVPLGLIGVIFALLLTGTNVNIQSIMGVIMMVGISVAYGNILIDRINVLVKEGVPVRDAVIQGAKDRLRPVLMTMLTTVFGLLPMALNLRPGGEANIPLARAIIGGVLAATILTLIIIPILYTLFSRKNTAPSNSNAMAHSSKIILLLAMVGLLTACNPGDNSAQNANPEAPTSSQAINATPTVEVVHPRMQAFEADLRLTGSLEANQFVKVHAMESGYLRSLNKEIGDQVKNGETIAVLENPELIQQFERAKAELILRKSHYERLKGIYDKTPDLTTIQDLEQAKAEFDKSIAEKKALATRIGFLTVRAPFSGVVTARYLDPGAVVQSAVHNGNAMPLVDVMEIDRLRLVLDFPESDLQHVRVGTSLKVTFPEVPGKVLETKVTRMAYALDAISRTMRMEADLTNKDLLLKPGMFAKVSIHLKNEAEALTVPLIAVTSIKNQQFIFRVRDGRVEKLQVVLGLENEMEVEVRVAAKETRKLGAQDEIIVKGKGQAGEGQAVIAKQMVEAAK
ncbi:MAG TPA: efflux RND transporter periplasmic adaptor subunit, partial [Bacteroidetes bacterium]|nr:efflux RND transporter periplasmic adaptor subunit [Bacteroidota bacterium]